MAKKKKHHRKKTAYKQKTRSTQGAAQVKDLDSKQPVSPQSTTDASASLQLPQAGKKPQPISLNADARRSVREVRHSLLLAGAIFIGLALLWTLFTFTKLGPAIYNTFKF